MASQSVDIMIKARDQASAAFSSVGKAASGMGTLLKGAAVAAATYFSAKAVLDFAQSSVQAFMESERGVNQLNAALTLLGAGNQTQDMLAFAESIQAVTTADDDAVVSVMKLGASMGNMSGDTLKQATVAAIGLSKAYGMDMESAMTLVSKAANGNTSAFGRYGIVLSDSMTDAEKFNAILDIGKQKFAMAEAETQTFSGKLAQMGNAWENAKEKLGEYIANSPLVMSAMDIAGTAIQNLGLSFDIVWTSIKLGLVTVWEEFKYVFSVRIFELINWFAENWRTIISDIFNNWLTYLGNLKDIFTEWIIMIVNMWKEGFKALWEFVKNPLDGIDLSGVFSAMKDGLKNVGKELNVFEGMEIKTPPPSFSERAASEVEKSLQDQLGGKVDLFKKAMSDNKNLDTSKLGPAQMSVAKADKASKEAGVAAVESRFLTGKTGTTENYAKKTSENTQRQTSILSQILKATQELKKGSPGQPGLAAASLI